MFFYNLKKPLETRIRKDKDMKIHHLAVIFILIMLPIIIVFSEYLNAQITIVNTEAIYDARLLDSTYDAIKAFQLNTINYD